MTGSKEAEYVGWIVGALVGFLLATFLGWNFIACLGMMTGGALIGAALGSLLGRVRR